MGSEAADAALGYAALGSGCACALRGSAANPAYGPVLALESRRSRFA